MSRTLSQFVIDIETILECEHGDISVQENFDEYTLEFNVEEGVIEDSMFDEDQVYHIADSITPNVTKVVIEVS